MFNDVWVPPLAFKMAPSSQLALRPTQYSSFSSGGLSDNSLTRMREFDYLAVAFTIMGEPRAPLSRKQQVQAQVRNMFLVGGRPRPYASSFTMVSNDYDVVADAMPGTFDGQNFLENSSITSDVLSTQDIFDGAIIACVLAFGYSFLNGQSSSSSFVSWPSESKKRNDIVSIDKTSEEFAGGGDDRTFNADDWKEMSREENYVLYNTKIRQRSIAENAPIRTIDRIENKLVLVALLALFVPIFSVEFFFALSRQFMCEMGMGGIDVVQKLCSPS